MYCVLLRLQQMKVALDIYYHIYCLDVYFPDECVPLGCMMINSVARLCPLLQPVSLFSLPNAPSLADLDWEESSTGGSGKIHLSDPLVGLTQ